jgi:hypothetical protein
VLLGSDVTSGVCVPSSASVAGGLRTAGIDVLNLALPGDGPFIQLAALREFGVARSPKVVVWTFDESTDLANLAGELRSPALANYLRPEFTQRLTDC